MEQVVLHVDVDAFFCQVEVLRNPQLQGKAVAIQQHQDIIAVNYPARAAGVMKHMPVPEASELLMRCGGHLVHVFTEEGMRVSYRPYREMSQALMRLLQSKERFPSASVVQKGSIDEAFILCQHPNSGVCDPWVDGQQLATDIRAAVKQELGLVVSVGVAANPFLAKLASSQSKPDGLKVLSKDEQVWELLQKTSVKKIPGLGGRVAEALLKLGLDTVWSLRTWTPERLAGAAGLKTEVAERLVDCSFGRDTTQVISKGPPKSIQVQMTLTPVPLPAPALLSNTMPVAGGRPGMLMPLPAGAPDSFSRIQSLLRAMSQDLLSRVLLDRQFESRWPAKASLQLITHGPQGRSSSKSMAFPASSPSSSNQAVRQDNAPGDRAPECTIAASLSVVGPPVPAAGSLPPPCPPASVMAPGAAVPQGPDSSLVVGERSLDLDPQLLKALCEAAEALAAAMLPLHAPAAPLVQVHLAASAFQPLASTSFHTIKHFFQTKASAPADAQSKKQQEQQQQQQHSTLGNDHQHGHEQAGERQQLVEPQAPEELQSRGAISPGPARKIAEGLGGPSQRPAETCWQQPFKRRRDEVPADNQQKQVPRQVPQQSHPACLRNLRASAPGSSGIAVLSFLSGLPPGPGDTNTDTWTRASQQLDQQLKLLGLSRCLARQL